MPSNLPLSIVLPEIIKHTPLWAWAVLAALVGLGVMQMRERRVGRARLTVAPAALAAYSLYGAGSAFGWHAPVLLAWAAGMAAAVAGNRLLRWPREVRPTGDGGFVLGGSAWPLVLMLAIYAQRYVCAVVLALHPAWRHSNAFAWPMALAWGLLSGLFLARALRMLSAGRARPRASMRPSLG